MSDLCTYLPDGGWPRFACDVLWQSTFVGLLAWGALRLLARQPAMRAWIAVLGLAGCLAIPVASAALRSGGYGLIAGPGIDTSHHILRGHVSSAEEARPLAMLAPDQMTFAGLDHAGPPDAESAVSWWAIIGVAWAGASLFFGGRLLLSLISVWRLRRTAVACGDERIVAAAADAARRVGLRQAPEVAVARSVSSPTVLALGRPRLLIPPQGAPPRGEPDWLAVFCHELAHVRRGDGWGRLLGELAVVLLPWQPVLWLLRRAYHRACDEACDDWAVSAGADPLSLASTLTRWVPRKAPMLAVGVIGSSNVRARVLRLLSLRGRPRHRLSRVGRFGSMTFALVLAAGVAAAQVREVESTPPPLPPKAQRGDSKGKEDRAHRAALKRTGWDPYRIEPPDVLEIEVVTPALKIPARIELGEHLRIAASGTPADRSIFGTFKVNSKGEIVLGNRYGSVRVFGLTQEEAQTAVRTHLLQVLRAPVVVVLLNEPLARPLKGTYLVGPDGTVTLNKCCVVHVAGKTIPEAEKALEEHLSEFFLRPDASVKVAAYNSKVYCVIIGGEKPGDNVVRLPVTGKETVLDAISHIGGLGGSSPRKIWIARPAVDGSDRKEILPVDWRAITRGNSSTNYNILPGDRIFIGEEIRHENSAKAPSGVTDSPDDANHANPLLK